MGGFVPNIIAAAEQAHQHERVNRVGHGKKAAAKLAAVGIARARPVFQLDTAMAVIVGQFGDADAAEQKRRP